MKYSKHLKNRHFGCTKVPGLGDFNPPNINNMGGVKIGQPRELSCCRNVDFLSVWSIKKMLFLFLFFSPLLLRAEAQYFQISGEKGPKKAPAVNEVVATRMDSLQTQTPGVMIIPLEMRAKDFEEAFAYLRRMNATGKVIVKLHNGSQIVDILGIDRLPGGTMLVFKLNSVTGMKYHIVKIEEIDTITNG